MKHLEARGVWGLLGQWPIQPNFGNPALLSAQHNNKYHLFQVLGLHRLDAKTFIFLNINDNMI